MLNFAAPRPTVLLMEPDDERRHRLSVGLAELGYELIPTRSAAETLRFAEGLGPSVVVGPHSELAEASATLLGLCDARSELRKTVLFLGEGPPPEDLDDDVRYLAIDGLVIEEVQRRLHMVLIGRELGLEPDLELRFLAGDLSLHPFLELAQHLGSCSFTGRLELEGGSAAFAKGRLLAVRATGLGGTNHRGHKAFCRLARRQGGTFRIHVAPTAARAEMEAEVADLVIEALQEMQIDWPDPRSRVRVADGAAGSDRLLLRAVSSCETLAELFDLMPSTDRQTLEALEKMIGQGLVRVDPPRSPVTIVTDSSCDLPREIARNHGIEIVPLGILFGEVRMQDGVELQPRDFYKMLETEEDHPRTEPPPEALFFEQFANLLEERSVLSLHISGRLSQTVVHAGEAARRSLADGRVVEVVDTHQVSMGLGLLALFASRMIERGHALEETRATIASMSERIHTLFVVDTLEYLAKGGRIGKAQAWVGKLLGIKPILSVVDGEVAPVDKVRGGRKAHPRIVQLLHDRVDPARPVVAAVAHARAPVWSDRLRGLLEESFRISELIQADIGPVVGTHAGPGCVGTVVFQPEPDEVRLVAPLH